MNENRRQVLGMLAEGKISADEAERLISVVERTSEGESSESGEGRGSARPAKYFRILVEDDGGSERVAIRIPIALIRAGMKLHTLIPTSAADGINEALRGKGIDFDVRDIKYEDFDELILALSDLEIDVQDGNSKVHIFAE